MISLYAYADNSSSKTATHLMIYKYIVDKILYVGIVVYKLGKLVY
uniref:Uncharacterized protein n=1 Tax=Lepeophtheirus salmonis TaxID=72036 RepID=A0A0K2VA74_LEPSM